MSKYYDLFFKRINKPGHYSWVTVNFGEGIRIHTDKDERHLCDLSAEVREKSMRWIKANVIPHDTPLNGYDSYGLKHVLQDRTNIYMSNNQFKELMLVCDIFPAKVDELNWRFCISSRSPIRKVQKDGRYGLLLPECVMEYNDEHKYFASETQEKETFLILYAGSIY